ncbi:MAG TPA: CoA transferase, partial [Mycobacterium sp.]|nr:CoA transferase [Mycobacterium sp.]
VPMGTFESRDGLVNIAAPGARLWQRFCDALDAADLRDNPSYASNRDRVANKVQLKVDINAVTCRHSTDHLVRVLNAAGVPCGPINDIGQAFEDPQVEHLKMAKPAPHEELGDLMLLRSPINLSAFPQAERFQRAAPDPGRDSADVLAELGLDEARIAELREAGVTR